MRAAIAGPAALPDVGLQFEGNLVGDLLYEVRDQAGALPLVQFTLDQLFARRDGHLLTEAAYRELGGVRGALARHAEATYAGLPDEEYRQVARALFLRLIEPGTSEQDTTRRRAPLSELELADAARTVRLRALAAVLAVALVVATGLTTYALQASRVAHSAEADAFAERNVALSRQLAAQALNHLDDQFDLALLLGVEANRVSNTLEARSSLFSGVYSGPHLITLLHGPLARASSVTFSPNGKILASGSDDGTVRLWDVAHQRHWLLPSPLSRHKFFGVSSVAFNSHGTTLAAASDDGSIRLWDVVHRRPLGLPFTATNGVISSMAFSPNGKVLASAGYDEDQMDGTIRLWDVVHGRLLGRPVTGHGWGGVASNSVMFSPDGTMLAFSTVDNSGHAIIHLWDVPRRQFLGSPINLGGPYAAQVAFSPDGTTLASGTPDAIQLWNVRHQVLLGKIPTGAAILDLAFSPDGTTLMAGTADGIHRWDISAVSLERLACRIANRNLTRQEWRQYLGDLPYHKTCPALP